MMIRMSGFFLGFFMLITWFCKCLGSLIDFAYLTLVFLIDFLSHFFRELRNLKNLRDVNCRRALTPFLVYGRVTAGDLNPGMRGAAQGAGRTFLGRRRRG